MKNMLWNETLGAVTHTHTHTQLCLLNKRNIKYKTEKDSNIKSVYDTG